MDHYLPYHNCLLADETPSKQAFISLSQTTASACDTLQTLGCQNSNNLE